jgi:transitional endoplasmic reticulum ATPase
VSVGVPGQQSAIRTLCSLASSSWGCRRNPPLNLGNESQFPCVALVHGPSGCGKSLLVRAIARHAATSVAVAQCMDIFAAPDPCERLRSIFLPPAGTPARAPWLLVLDGVECLGGTAGRASDQPFERSLLAQLCTCLAECGRSNVFVIATAGAGGRIPPEAAQAGLGTVAIPIGPPSPRCRLEIMRFMLAQMPVAAALLAKPLDLASASQNLHGYTGADLQRLCRDAALVS